MKRLWTAIVFIIVLALGGLYNLYAVSRTVNDIAVPLEQAAIAVQQNDLPSAGRLTAQAHQHYLNKEGYLSAVISEKLLDEVRLGFARTSEGIKMQDNIQLAVELAGLRQAVDDLLRTESIGMGNIF